LSEPPAVAGGLSRVVDPPATAGSSDKLRHLYAYFVLNWYYSSDEMPSNRFHFSPGAFKAVEQKLFRAIKDWICGTARFVRTAGGSDKSRNPSID